MSIPASWRHALGVAAVIALTACGDDGGVGGGGSGGTGDGGAGGWNSYNASGNYWYAFVESTVGGIDSVCSGKHCSWVKY